MYRTIVNLDTDSGTMGTQIMGSVFDFITIFIGSFVIGASFALLASFGLKKQAQYYEKRREKLDVRHRGEEA